jgi:RNA polymerase sigma factor (sigma-70 family)
MVLGSALTAIGQGAAQAREIPDHTIRAVSDMSRYCTTCWRNARLNADSWDDCTQEVFSRLLQRIPPASWDCALKEEAEERREFLRAIDAVKKRVQRSRKPVDLPLEVVADHREERERKLEQERREVQRAAASVLSDRQQAILRLSLEGWSVHEIAAELAVPADRVSDDKYKAIRKLRTHFCEASDA